jgi:hypothetical protein
MSSIHSPSLQSLHSHQQLLKVPATHVNNKTGTDNYQRQNHHKNEVNHINLRLGHGHPWDTLLLRLNDYRIPFT